MGVILTPDMKQRHREDPDGAAQFVRSYLAAALRREPTLTLTPKPAGMSIVSPVEGLRPVRAARATRSTDRMPGIETFSPLLTESSRISLKDERTASASALLVPAFEARAATRSLREIATKAPCE